MRTDHLINLADSLAEDLLEFGKANGLSAHDLLMLVALSERLLQTVVAPTAEFALNATQEADATFTAVSTCLEAN